MIVSSHSAAIGLLNKEVFAPSQGDRNVVKRVMWYLMGTSQLTLELPATADPKLEVYVDADWAGAPLLGSSASG